MQLGIFMDLRNPPWCARPWPLHYQASLDVAAGAESVGLDSVWLSEHHGFSDGYLSQPLLFAAAVAARTRRVRVGTAVLLAGLRHPRHIAEQAVLLDALSGGRLELGLGAGYRLREYDAFGASFADRFQRLDELVAEVRRLVDEAAAPAPVQRPIPLWLGLQTPAGARRAGRAGVGLLSLDSANLAPYLDGLAEGGHDPGAARLGGVVELIVSDDPERDRARIRPHVAHQLETYRRYRYEDRPAAEAPPAITVEALAELEASGSLVPGAAVVTAGEAIDRLRSITRGLPVEHLYLWASIAGMPVDVVERHIELLGTQVKPALADGAGS